MVDTRSSAHRDQHVVVREAIIKEGDALESTQRLLS